MQYDHAGRLRASSATEASDRRMRRVQLFDRALYRRHQQSPAFMACLDGRHKDCGVQVGSRTCGCYCHRPRFKGMQ